MLAVTPLAFTCYEWGLCGTVSLLLLPAWPLSPLNPTLQQCELLWHPEHLVNMKTLLLQESQQVLDKFHLFSLFCCCCLFHDGCFVASPSRYFCPLTSPCTHWCLWGWAFRRAQLCAVAGTSQPTNGPTHLSGETTNIPAKWGRSGSAKPWSKLSFPKRPIPQIFSKELLFSCLRKADKLVQRTRIKSAVTREALLCLSEKQALVESSSTSAMEWVQLCPRLKSGHSQKLSASTMNEEVHLWVNSSRERLIL